MLVVRLTKTTVEEVESFESTLSVEQRGKLDQLQKKYESIFTEPKGLPPRRAIEHDIQLLLESSLPKIGLYRTSIVESEEIERQIQELLDEGVIKSRVLSCGSSIVLVPKKDGSWRMCVNFKALNEISIKNRYPVPRINDLLDQLQRA